MSRCSPRYVVSLNINPNEIELTSLFASLSSPLLSLLRLPLILVLLAPPPPHPAKQQSLHARPATRTAASYC
jgi:hypothetical protein